MASQGGRHSRLGWRVLAVTVVGAGLLSGGKCGGPDVLDPSTAPPTTPASTIAGLVGQVTTPDEDLAWSPVAGATRYLVAVIAGEQVWIWEGATATVAVTDVIGDEQLPPDAHWYVLASNDIAVVAASGAWDPPG